MYNLYQYSKVKASQKLHSKEEKIMSTFWNKHQNFKRVAEINCRARLDDFIDSQIANEMPQIIPDGYMERSLSEHHSHLQKNEVIQRISGNKINKQREYPKSQIKYRFNNTSNKSVESLKLTREDMKLLPSQIQKSQIINSAVSYSAQKFNQKADALLKQFQKSKEKFDRLAYLNRDRYRLCHTKQFMQMSQQAQNQQPSNKYFRKQQNPQQASLPVCFNNQLGSTKTRSKTYFKLAKTQQLFTKDSMKKMQLDSLLSRSHYNRIKNDQYATKITGWPSVNSFPISNSVVLS